LFHVILSGQSCKTKIKKCSSLSSFLLSLLSPFLSLSSFLLYLFFPLCVNFINVMRTNFLYERRFGSFFYVYVTREKLLKQRSYEKFARITLMKLTVFLDYPSHLWSISSTFYVRLFRTNVILAAFFYVCTYVCTYIKKAAKTTFVRNIRTFNVDEIDTLLLRLQLELNFHRMSSSPVISTSET